MSPSERQAAIWDIVYQQRYETVPIAIQQIIENSRRNGTSLHSPAE